MKRNCCSMCGFEIDRHDFFVESTEGKICSDCMVQAGPIEEDCAHLFTVRGPKQVPLRAKGQDGSVSTLPLKEAL